MRVVWFSFLLFPSGSHGGTPRTFGICGLYQRGGGIGNERERLFIETTSLMTSKTMLINRVAVYEKYTKQMVI